jgi:hypothetical protein
MARVSICTFTAAERQGVWAVTRDGVFYGDYLSREQAIASAQAGARAIEARGGAARVVVRSGDQRVPH